MRGTSKNMMQFTEYNSSVVSGVATELERRIDILLKQGILDSLYAIVCCFTLQGFPRWLLIVDPGIGFAKTFGQNMELIRSVGEFKVRKIVQHF